MRSPRKARKLQPAGVIDGDVQMVPADAPALALSGAIPAHPMADALEAAQALDVEIDHLAGPLAFVADHRRTGIKEGQTVEAEPSQHQGDRRTRQAKRVQSPVPSAGRGATARSPRSAPHPADADNDAGPNCDRPAADRRCDIASTSDSLCGQTRRRPAPPGPWTNPDRSSAPKALDLTASDAHSWGRSFGELR